MGHEVPDASGEINGMARIGGSRDEAGVKEATDLMGDDARLELLDTVGCEHVVDVHLPCRFPFIIVREECKQFLSEVMAEEEPGLGAGGAGGERLVMRVEERASNCWARHHDHGRGRKAKEENGPIFVR